MMPGAFSPISRFQRLYLLNQAVGSWPYSDKSYLSITDSDKSYSPFFGYTRGKAALVEAMILIEKVRHW